jgi:TetR/AcrR family transcriptional regulator, cholesterol catabolism regulator
MTKQDKTKKYIDKAMEVFRYDGLRLSLDEVADKMGITKKTLYNHFESKEILLCQCVQSLMIEMRDSVHAIFVQSDDTIGNLRKAFEEVDATFSSLSPIFFYDMKKMYPEYVCTEHASGFGFFKEEVRGNLVKGVEEGLYLNNLDVDFISDYLSYTTFSYYFNKLITNNNVVIKYFFKTALEFNLRSLVSEKGRSRI